MNEHAIFHFQTAKGDSLYVRVEEHATSAGSSQCKASLAQLETAVGTEVKTIDIFATSFSHSKNGSAVIIRGPAGRGGVGIDLERSDRPISDRLDHRLRQAANEKHLPALDRWLIKEACFKASRKLKPRVITEFHILSHAIGMERAVHSCSKTLYQFHVFKWKNWKLAWSVPLDYS